MRATFEENRSYICTGSSFLKTPVNIKKQNMMYETPCLKSQVCYG